MKHLLRIIAISVSVAALTLGLIQLLNKLCDSYSKLLFKDDPDDYYSWPT